MRDFTNLSWPETPFGADQRPYGRRAHMLAAVDITWASSAAADPFPRCVSTVYLRVTPARPLTVEPATLPVGVRATVADAPTDLDALLGVVDRALARARRHAYLLAGHQLGAQLARLDALSAIRRPGIETVLAAWNHRDVKARGIARVHDTADHTPVGRLDVDLDAMPAADIVPAATAAAEALARCLAIGLAAGHQRGLLLWEETFSTREAMAAAVWDLLDHSTDVTGP